MSANFADITEAMRGALLDRYQATRASGVGVPFLAFQLGQPIPDSTFETVQAQPQGTSRLLALEFIARQANRVGLVSNAMYCATGLDIDALYQQLVDGSAANGDGVALFEAARQTAVAALDDWLYSVDPPAAASPEARYRRIEVDPIDWFESTSDAWADIHVENRSQTESGARPPISYGSPISKWRTAPLQLHAVLHQQPNLETIKQLADGVAGQFSVGVAGDAPAMPPNVGRAFALGSPANVPGRPIRIHPAGANWSHVVPGPQINNDPGIRDASFRRFRDQLLSIRLNVDQDGYEANSSGFSLELQTCLLSIRRPWLSTQLLNLENWFVPTFAKGSLASGTGEDEKKLLEVLPIACVLVRNATIRATQCSEEDRRHASIASHMGPIAMLGRSIDSSSDEVLIRIPGKQLVGWICQVMPALPPSNAPTT
ncbi:hypothetical protein [Massilia sp. Root335]|uniref:hypothetical protein n=1 Tax=Massilia sp. Root335 TaxID=1736517 RepID=UPI0006F54BC4|nr:hypothetical protein [Massilia sp. Root335]KQV42855.1 hypothetical protein ASC93_16105 [Massilia sp. Root335]